MIVQVGMVGCYFLDYLFGLFHFFGNHSRPDPQDEEGDTSSLVKLFLPVEEIVAVGSSSSWGMV